MKEVLLIIIYLACSQIGMLLIKLGSDKSRLALKPDVLALTASWQMLLGLGLYIVSFILFVVLVGRYNLSYFIPLVGGAAYVITFLLSVFILKERLHTTQVIGFAVIIIGIVLINIRK